MSELLETKIDLLIEKVQEELADISYQLKVANDMKKIEVACKIAENECSDVDILYSLKLLNKLDGYLNYRYKLDEEIEKMLKEYDKQLRTRYKG